MAGNALIFILLSGLGSLPSCFPRQYLLVEEKMNWTEAQSYCRQHYTDLATVSSEEDVAKLNDTVGSHRSWIGLYDDINSWRWSLQNKSYYGEGEAEFRMWDSGQPDNSGSNEHCVVMNPGGLWFVSSCFSARPFVCYNDRTKGSSRWILVNKDKSWSDAQSYCRQNYTDLASIRNLTENEEIRGLISNSSWIGLFRGTWKWSDGSTMSFTKWDDNRPYGGYWRCVASYLGKWLDYPCWLRLYFACYSDVVKMQVVKVRLQSASSADLEAMKDELLQQLRQRLKDQGVSDDVQLRWVTQPDGRVFHKEGKEEEKNEEEQPSGSVPLPPAAAGSPYPGTVFVRELWCHLVMAGNALIFILLSGLGSLPSCFPRQYHLVEKSMTWSEAQSYCRQHYTDLATVSSEEDVAKLNDAVGSHHSGIVWIGLYDDINSWKWSLQNKSYYGEGEAEFRMWGTGQPNNYNDEHCVFMDADGEWWDYYCSRRYPFVCYNDRTKGSSRWILVEGHKSWSEAQSYCRQNYTDLASVRNLTENEEIRGLISDWSWIGLFRDAWKW
ncbi:uncharacterized protein LOC115363677 [Myripristis murdjan]|uniref:uncharacterized protein LOC115363677 n=1 Tax=Myripristis murdjan TaxID=586833 RepID=UPI0011760D80|nr:uncharacterized protein LOC115363677 [Myripristis murdjan]